MDLRIYYQKVRDAAAEIKETFPVVVSLETTEGGKEGILTEVTRGIAARMLVEGVARLASSDEAEAFRKQLAEAQRAVQEAVAASKVQLAVFSADDLKALKGVRSQKG
jgi:hypothetical protein